MSNPLLVLALPQENANNRLDDLGLEILYTGVGKVNATLALMRRLAQGTAPSLIINAGSAGSHTLPAGHVVAAAQFHQRDMDATAMGFALGETPFESPILLANGLAVPGLTSAICYTGDSFVTTAHTQLTLEVIDMEAYALAKVCDQLGHRFVCLKFITDGADGQAASDWASSVILAADKLADAIAVSLAAHPH